MSGTTPTGPAPVRRVAGALALTCLLFTGACSSGPTDHAVPDAGADVSDLVSFDEYRRRARITLQGQEAFLVEGDLVFLTEDALRAHFEATRAQAVEKLAVFTELRDEDLDEHSDPPRMHFGIRGTDATSIRYCMAKEWLTGENVTTNIGSNPRPNTFVGPAAKAQALADLQAAMWEWEQVANVHFIYVESADDECSVARKQGFLAGSPRPDGIDFIVGPDELMSMQGYAIAPYMMESVNYDGGVVDLPSTTYRRGGVSWIGAGTRVSGTLTINYPYIASQQSIGKLSTPVGVMRHELGHMLGFRHEHVWGDEEDCGPVVFGVEVEEVGGLRGTDITLWGGERLTPYDPDSVMHYADKCGVPERDYTLSELDGVGARRIYGPPVAWYVAIQ